ncbi:hypothetical protein ACH4PU_35510 [Streptomyces sp. NPDC021100]|uniref:hypothetical protein n=1 Tax=Streptomyces sp. NPDC021100 TaxID=3365114 RepID=UPI003798F7A8
MNPPVLRRVLTAFAALALTTSTTVIAAPPSAYAAEPKSCRQLLQKAENAVNLAIIKLTEERLGRAWYALHDADERCDDLTDELHRAEGAEAAAISDWDTGKPESAEKELREAKFFLRKAIDKSEKDRT